LIERDEALVVQLYVDADRNATITDVAMMAAAIGGFDPGTVNILDTDCENISRKQNRNRVFL
jgi:hypothetical protein